MKLGVPVLANYEGLAKLIASAERGSLKPSGYIIVDNGGRLFDEFSDVLFDERVDVVSPLENLGVAASWNIMLECGEPIIIVNDDVVLGKYQFEEMARDLATHPFVGNSFCLFGQTPECTERVDYYDENFFPAYYEDSDYHVRLHRAGIEPFWNCSEPVEHAGSWTTSRLLGSPAWLSDGVERCRKYFVEKWGTMPNVSFDGYFAAPFNGTPPPGWSLRRGVKNDR